MNCSRLARRTTGRRWLATPERLIASLLLVCRRLAAAAAAASLPVCQHGEAAQPSNQQWASSAHGFGLS